MVAVVGPFRVRVGWVVGWPSVTSPARADGRGGAGCCRGWGRCRVGLPPGTPPGRLQPGDDASGSGSGLWPCSSTVDVRRWCGSRVHTRFASFSGLDVDNQVLPEPLRRAPVTAAPTGNGTARHGPEQRPHRLVRSCPAPSGPGAGSATGDGSATGNTPRGNTSAGRYQVATSRPGAVAVLPFPVRPSRAEGSGRQRNEEAEARGVPALFRHVTRNSAPAVPGTVAGVADCSAGRAEQPPRNSQPFRNSGTERTERPSRSPASTGDAGAPGSGQEPGAYAARSVSAARRVARAP